MNDQFVKRDTASVLCILQMSHQTQLSPQRSGRLLVTEKVFYTGHLLATEKWGLSLFPAHLVYVLYQLEF